MPSFLHATTILLGLSCSASAAVIRRSQYPRASNATGHIGEWAHIMATKPQLDHDPAATSSCSWWFDNTEYTSCGAIIGSEGITLADFRRWVS